MLTCIFGNSRKERVRNEYFREVVGVAQVDHEVWRINLDGMGMCNRDSDSPIRKSILISTQGYKNRRGDLT